MERYGITNSQVPLGGPEDSLNNIDLNNPVDRLNNLIATNRGIIEVYNTASERLENESYAALLHDAAEQHNTFVVELSNLVTRYSLQPVDHANAGSMVKKAWVVLKSAVTEGDGPILAEVAQDAEKVLDDYGETMGADLPDDARELLRKQMSAARITHEKLSPLSAAVNSR